jgi:ribosome-associated protein
VPLSAIATSVSRSSGPGGQNVNKQNTRIELRISLSAIQGLTDATEQRLRMLAGKRLSTSGELRMVSQQTRSLETNREIAIEQLRLLLEEACHLPRIRHATKPTRGSRRRRLDAKRRRGEVKASRKFPPV